MNLLNGKSYVIWIDTVTPLTASSGSEEHYRPVVCGVSNGISLDAESISTRNKCDGGFDNSESGYISWNFDLDGFAIGLNVGEAKANFQTIADLLLNKTKFWAKQEDLNKTITREGKVRVGAFAEKADIGTPYSFNASFVGIGRPIMNSNFIPVGNPIYYGSSATQPITNSDVVSLNQTPFAANVTLNTGITNRFFTVAFEQSVSITSIIDLDLPLFNDLTTDYLYKGNVTISGLTYKIYTLELAIPYSTNHRHQITLSI